MQCPKCGHAQADGRSECVRCQVIFSKWAAANARARVPERATEVAQEVGPQSPGNAFSARAIYALKPDRVYRVSCTNKELLFIRIGGQNFSVPPSPIFGLAGMLIGAGAARLEESRRRKEAAAIEAIRSASPGELLSTHKDNFRIANAEIAEASIDAAPSGLVARVRLPTTGLWQGQHGPLAGRWSYATRQGEKLKMEFPTLLDMETALRVLTSSLGSRLAVRVQWNGDRKVFLRNANLAVRPR